MATDEITIRVDSKAADAYRAASDEQRRKFDLLLSLRLRQIAESSMSLKDVIHEASRQARESGLTPEILESILNER